MKNNKRKTKIGCSIRPFDCANYKHKHLCNLDETECQYAKGKVPLRKICKNTKTVVDRYYTECPKCGFLHIEADQVLNTKSKEENIIPGTASNSYYRKWYHFYEYCSQCFAKDDKHDMNCIECCPVKNGKAEKIMYADTQELQDKQNEVFKKLGRWKF